jgi:hypothetical protein
MTAKKRISFRSIFGNLLGQGAYGQLATRHDGVNVRDLTDRVAHATITISAEAATTADTRDITIQLKDHLGQNIDYAARFEILMFSAADMLDFVAAGGSTGVQAGASGKLLAVVAKKQFEAITTAAGLWVGSYLDTGTAAGYLAVRLPNGKIIGGGLVTNA